MPHSISHNPSDHWASVSKPSKTEPLRLTKRRPRTPGLPQDSAPSSPSVVSAFNDGLSNSIESAIRRPSQNSSPVTFFDPNDPAFSSDPFHHPDHDGSSLIANLRKEDMNKDAPPSRSVSQDTEDEPPPSYDDSVPSLNQTGSLGRSQPQNASTASLSSNYSNEGVQDSSHIRERAQASYSPTPTPFSSSPALPQQSEHDDVAEPEELLAYLNDDRDVSESVPDRNIPMSLRPHQGLPVTAQTTADVPPRSGQGPNTTSILRSTTLPSSTTRTMSEPLARTNTERPHLPRRGNTTGNASTSTPRRVLAELDRIDELDESTPSGVPLHHRGPYEVRGKVDTPPRRVVPFDRRHQPPPKQHVLVATTPLNAPPQPVPFRLNLKPGEFLTRVPPSRSQTTPPERLSTVPTGPYLSPAAEQPAYKQEQPVLHSHAIPPRNVYRGDVRNINSFLPEQLYDDYAQFSSDMPPRDVQRPPYQADVRNNSPSTSTNASRSDLRPDAVAYSHPRMQQERASVQQPPQQSSSLSRSISQPVYPSSASVYSTSSSGMSRVPPSAADRHRPKRIVMPTPLQSQNQNTSYTLPSELMRRTGQNGDPARPPPPSQPVAAVIPIHDPKKGNFLKKRASTGTEHQQHKHLAPERMPSTKGFFGLGLGFGKSLTPEQESNLPKTGRKLSKRGKI